MTEEANTWELAIKTRLSGAPRHTPLPNNGRVLIGRALDNDVVLRQLGPDNATVVALVCHRPSISVQVKNGNVHVGDEHYQAGDEFSLSDKGFSMGTLTLCVPNVLPITEHSDGKQPAQEQPVSPTATAVTTSTDDPMPAVSAVTSAISQPWWYRKAALAASVVFTVSALLIGWQVRAFSDTQTVDTQSILAQHLTEQELTFVELNKKGSNWDLVGRVDTRSQYLNLERFITEHNLPVSNNVINAMSTRTQIEDLFRINGVTAKTEFDEKGTLWVYTFIRDNGLLESVKSAVANDMPKLKNWEIANTPPEDSIPEDPGKQVVMIVSDEPAYILTADQTRYFVDSLLPSGHRISAIEEGRVMLEKSGERSELSF